MKTVVTADLRKVMSVTILLVNYLLHFFPSNDIYNIFNGVDLYKKTIQMILMRLSLLGRENMWAWHEPAKCV